jgi:Nif-specific regulatory protein
MPATDERDVYRALVELAFHEDVEPLLRQALALIAGAARARQGYLEIRDEDGTVWWIAHGLLDDEVEGVRAIVSRGVISEAIATGETIVTPSALLDPRFRDRESVTRGNLEAVLCAPIAADPPRGVLYLQGWAAPDEITPADRDLVETCSRYLGQLVDRLLAHRHRRRETDPTRAVRARLNLAGVVGSSPALAEVLEQVALVAPLDVSVLLTGDNGTGKNLLAKLLHDHSPRAHHPFVEVNCAALPETLLESELFGAVPGAHSTATRRTEGRVGAASRGTLFLDDVSDLHLNVQAKLLQLLQEKTYFPLGSSKAEVADVRVIAATNTDLERAVAERRFRQDLFYRLHVLPLRVPSLDERRSDIPELVAAFLRDACARHGLRPMIASPAVIRAAEAAAWPGNIRQLAHAVEAAAIRASADCTGGVETRHLFPNGNGGAAVDEGGLTYHERTRRFQRDVLRETLTRCDWNVADAARELDLGRTHVYNLIKTFGLREEER